MDSANQLPETTLVFDKNGQQGTIAQSPASSSPTRQADAAGTEEQVILTFRNGQQFLVPRAMLVRQSEDRYYLPFSIEELLRHQRDAQEHSDLSRATEIQADGTAHSHAQQVDQTVIPVIREEATVQKRLRESGVVEIRKQIYEHMETVDEPLLAEEVEVERVAVNRLVDQAPSVRHEGDTMIIPLLEEVLVVEKRLVLREEVHVRRVQKTTRDPQQVLLREEQVEIVRRPGADSDLNSATPSGTPPLDAAR